jgi:hypothetical protein
MSDETSEVSSFRFLFSSSAPSRAVLEFDTAVNPVRISLSQEQLDRLGTEAKIASVKLSRLVFFLEDDSLSSLTLPIRCRRL